MLGLTYVLLQMLISLKMSISFHCGSECGKCVNLESLIFLVLCCFVETILVMILMESGDTSSDSSNGSDTPDTKGRLNVSTTN
jgi:hypothetical protein